MNDTILTSVYIFSIILVLIGITFFVLWIHEDNKEHNEYRSDQEDLMMTKRSETRLYVSLPLMIIGCVGLILHHIYDNQLPPRLENPATFFNSEQSSERPTRASRTLDSYTYRSPYQSAPV